MFAGNGKRGRRRNDAAKRKGWAYSALSDPRGFGFVEVLEDRRVLAPLAWAASASLPTARGGAVAAQAANGATVVIGGPTSDVPTFAAANPSWQTIVSAAGPLEESRVSPGVGALAGGGILVFGGNAGGADNYAFKYDYTSGNPGNAASLHTARYAMGYATDENHHVYAIGGKDGSGHALASVESYNPSTNQWTTIAALPKALAALSAVADGAGHVYAFGGLDSSGALSSTVYCYTISSNTWATVASLPTATDYSAAVRGSDGKLYVLGGATATGVTANVESYNASTNAWTVETSLPTPVRGEAVTVDSLGRIVVAGGYNADGSQTAAVYVSQQLNQPDAGPVITSTAPTTATAGVVYSYQALATVNPQPTYALLSAPAGMTVNASTGLISWTPTLAEAGSQSATLQVSNFAGSVTQNFNVSVALSPPVFSGGSSTPAAIVGQPFAYTVVASGTPAPTYSFVSAPAGATIDPVTGVINWTPTTAQEGVGGNTFTVAATNYSGTTTKTLTTAVAPVVPTGLTAQGSSLSTIALNWNASNDPSVVSYKVYSRVFHHDPKGSGGSYSYPLIASNVTTNSYTIAGLNSGAGGTYLVSAVNSAGVESARSATASATSWVPASLPNYVLLSSGAVWDLPVAVNAGQSVQVTLLGSGNPAPTYSVLSGPSTVSVDPNTGVVTYSPDPSEGGLIGITFQATNAAGSATETVQFQVNPQLLTPVVSWPTPADIVYGSPLTSDQLDATANDPVTGQPVPGTFTYSWTLGTYLAAAAWPLSVTFTPTDTSHYLTATASTVLNVLPITPTIVFGDPLVYNGAPQDPSVSAIGIWGSSPVSGSFTFSYNGDPTPPTNVGVYSVIATFTSADQSYLSASATGQLVITPATPSITISGGPYDSDGNPHGVTTSVVGVDGVTALTGGMSVTYNGSSTLPSAPGAYAVAATFTPTDNNYATTTSYSVLLITPAIQLLPDAQDPSLTDLVWTGTTGADRVRFDQIDSSTILVTTLLQNGVVVNSVSTYSGVTGMVMASGRGGDDTLDASGLQTTHATLDGGAGNNTLYGGQAGDTLIGGSNGGEGRQGNNVIIAGNGDNVIYGNDVVGRYGATGGNNLIVSGSGNDWIYGSYGSVVDKHGQFSDGGEGGHNLIVGGGGQDLIFASQDYDGAEGGHGSILIAGTTTLDQAALLSILSEWSSADSQTIKIADISGTGSPAGLNGANYLIAGVTVFDDGVLDELVSDSKGAANWLFSNVNQDYADRVKSTDISTDTPT